MRTVRRLLYRDIVWSVVFVAVAFLSLFFFIDVVDALEGVGRDGRTLGGVFWRAALELPGHFYELFPIAVLIGAIYAMARLAQSSEFTILRTAGLGPGRALWLLALPGLAFAALTFVVGDHLAPWSERAALAAAASARGLAPDAAGAWLKDRRRGSAGEADPAARNVSVNVGAMNPDGTLQRVRVYEMDTAGRLRTTLEAERAVVGQDGVWRLLGVTRTDWPTPDGAGSAAPVQRRQLPELAWPSTLEQTVVAAALMPTTSMSTVDLWRYASHLADQDQAAQRQRIQFWKKALYPLACLVMMALALPFAYLHARAGAVSYKVFGGIMLGISFVVLNNASGHLGLLNDWTPWIAAAAPSGLYLLLSMAAFAWLVRYR